jgi:hypothetical protein
MDTSNLRIVKPSFWGSRREIHDAAGMTIAHFKMTNWTQNKAEGEARGRQFRFAYDGWDSRYNYMSDMSGTKIATFEPVGWWGTQFKLVYDGVEYSWKPNGWGTGFTLKKGEEEIMRVHCGGYFRPGTITMQGDMQEKELIPLILYGLYEMQIYSAQAASASPVVVTTAT